MSANGRYAVIQSDATNLVPGDGNGQQDCFVTSRTNFRNVRLTSVGNAGQALNGLSYRCQLSTNGSMMVFSSFATITLKGLFRSGFAHENSAAVALRTCSSCHTSRRVVRSFAFETTVKWALLTSIHWSAAKTGSAARADRRIRARHAVLPPKGGSHEAM